MNKIQSVSDFKNLWDFLNSPHYIYYAEKIGDTATLHIKHDNSDFKETRECEIQLNKPKKQDFHGWKLLCQLEAFRIERESPDQSAIINEVEYTYKFVVDEFSTQNTRQGFLGIGKEITVSDENYRIEIPTSYTRRQIFPIREMISITGINKPEVSFELAFPELNEFVEKYPKLSLTSLESVLKELIDSGHEYIEILGIKVPSIYLTYFGLGLIIVISSYYLIHFNQLAFLLTKCECECSIAWIGIYHGISAKILMLLSSIVIPIFVVIYLAYLEINAGRMNIVITLCVATQALISIIALQKLIRLWIVIRKHNYHM
jgi:hypothetical protein